MLEKTLYERSDLYQAVVAQMVSALGIMIHFTVYSREIKSVGSYENLKFISEALNLHVMLSYIPIPELLYSFCWRMWQLVTAVHLEDRVS